MNTRPRKQPPPRLGLPNVPPRGPPPTSTHTRDPPPGSVQRHPPLLPFPNAESVVGRGALRDPRGPRGKGAPQEGHDFPRLGEGTPVALRGAAHAEGGERDGGREGAFLGDWEPQRPARLLLPDRPPEPRSWPHLCAPPAAEPQAAALAPAAAPPYLRPQVHARGPQPRVPRRAGEGGRPPTPTRPGSPLPRPPPQPPPPPPVPFAAMREPPPLPSRPGPRSPR